MSNGRRRLSRIGGLSWTAVEIAGGWAENSERLTQKERRELAQLREKAHKKGTPLTKGERGKYASLVNKGIGSERLRNWFSRGPAEAAASPRETLDLDAAQRLERAAKLRDNGVITTEDFEKLKARYLEEL